MNLPTIRQTYLLIFAGCVGLIAVGMVMQYVMKLEPCPLCITQRVFIVLVGLTALIGALHNPSGNSRRTYGLGVILFAVIGAGFSSRQLWLQSLPPELAPACGPSLSYMFDSFPLMEALQVLLQGDGNCADVKWSFLGGSIPFWTLIAFIGLALFGLWQSWRKAST